MPFPRMLALLLCASPLCCQDAFLIPGKGQPSCPLLDASTTIGSRIEGAVAGIPRPARILSLRLGSNPGIDLPFNPLEPMRLPPASRPQLSLMSVVDALGNKTLLQDKVGKVMIIGFWHTACEPSIKWLEEMANLQGKEEKFGFLIFPVNVDSSQWVAVKNFLQFNRSFFEGLRVYRSGTGKEGYQGLISPLPATPTTLFIDRQGRLAQVTIGFEAGALVKSLKALLLEPVESPANPKP